MQDIQIGTRASRAQYQYTLVGTDAEEVLDWAEKLAEQAARASGFCAKSPRRRRKAGCGLIVQVDREKAGRLGVSMQAINDTLNNAFGQRQISTIYGQANQYRVILEAMPQYQRDPASLVEALCDRRPAARRCRSAPLPASSAPRRRSRSRTRSNSRR